MVKRARRQLFLLSAWLALATAAAATTPGVRFEYENKFTWDKKQLDSPPLPIGGEPALSKGLDYPMELRYRHIQGASSVAVTVDSQARVQSVRFSPHLASELEKIVTTAVYQCRWQPGRRHGRVVTGTVWFPVRFILLRR
jgi:outer membrane biosynthesis protein TonB